MESLIVILVLALLAVPASIIYLLVRVSSLQQQVGNLQKAVHAQNEAKAAPRAANKPTTQPISQPKYEAKDTTVPKEQTNSALLVRSQHNEEENGKENPWLALEPQKPAQISPQPSSQSSYQQQPTPLNKGLALIKRYFTEGNLIVRIGVLVLFVGVAFLLKYASDNRMLSIELRVTAVTLVGIGILVLGWYLRLKKPDYALVLQGAGIGILYLTAFAALKLFNLLPASFVFVCLLVMVMLSALLAIVQNARVLAVLAASGGFLAPVLSSTGEGSHIALFTYYLLLNLGIFTIAWFQSWRLLNLVGFGFTFVIGGAWGLKSFQPEFFASTELFLIIFFALYVAISLLFASKQPPNLKGYVDSTLVFGLPIVVFSMQAGLVKPYPFALAYSAFALGFFYLCLAWIYQKGIGKFKPDKNLHLLSESFLAIGVVFASLTIPFALDGEWIASAWALEGTALLWISVKQNRRLGVVFSLALQVLGGVGFLGQTHTGSTVPVLNSIFIGGFLVAAAGMFTSYYLKNIATNMPNWIRQFSLPFLFWGLIWWGGSGFYEIVIFVVDMYRLPALLLFISLSTGIALWLEKRFNWQELQHKIVVHLCLMLALFFISSQGLSHAFERFGWLGWPAAFAVLWYILFDCDTVNKKARKGEVDANTIAGNPNEIYSRILLKTVQNYLPLIHLTGFWLAGMLITWECMWFIKDILMLKNAWLTIAYALPALFIVHGIMTFTFWPIQLHNTLYRQKGLLPVVSFLVLWVVIANIASNGSASPLPYVPLLNPLDIVQVFVLMGIYLWWQSQRCFLTESPSLKIPSFYLNIGFAALVFFACNGMLLRALHHLAHVPYSADGIINSAVAQAALSVFWTLMGLSIMIMSSRKGWRNAWISAATLLGITVAKLLLIDLGDRDALVTIVSFIIVGFLLLIVGYYSPIPPNKTILNKTIEDKTTPDDKNKSQGIHS